MFYPQEAMASPPGHSQALLPDPQVLVLKGIVRTDSKFILYVNARQAAACPKCSRVSRSRHSSYVRRSQDLAWEGQTVEILLSAGRAIAFDIATALQDLH